MPKTEVLYIEISVPPVNKEKTYIIHVNKVFEFNKIKFRLKNKVMNKTIDYVGIQCFFSYFLFFCTGILLL